MIAPLEKRKSGCGSYGSTEKSCSPAISPGKEVLQKWQVDVHSHQKEDGRVGGQKEKKKIIDGKKDRDREGASLCGRNQLNDQYLRE